MTASLTLALSGTAAANAAQLDDPVVTTVTETAPMQFTGQVDDAVAKANGFKVIKNADGTETSVPVSAKAKALVLKSSKARGLASPNSTASGTCGSSYYTLTRISGTVVSQFTGYKVILPTFEQHWVLHMWTPKDSRTNDVSGLNASATWSTIVRSTGLKSTVTVDGGVLPGSYATLITGDYCYSASPHDHLS
jgi:hypothetical protein